jgi:hypothetical protein
MGNRFNPSLERNNLSHFQQFFIKPVDAVHFAGYQYNYLQAFIHFRNFHPSVGQVMFSDQHFGGYKFFGGGIIESDLVHFIMMNLIDIPFQKVKQQQYH